MNSQIVPAIRRIGNTGAVLDVVNLAVSYPTDTGRVTVVDGVSLSVERGETLGLVGESGSGKSVTAMAIMGLLHTQGGQIDSGSVCLEGEELVGLSNRKMRDIRGKNMAMVFQEPMTSLDPAFTVGDQISEVVRRHCGLSRRAARSHAIELLNRVGIPSARNRSREYPHNFSGGMRQRVLIAMALSCGPSLLIADEPTTALDVTVQARVLELLKELQAEFEMGLLLVTHDLGVIAAISDRVAVMYAGSIVEESPTEAVFDRPLHPYTEGLLQAQRISAHRGLRLGSIPGEVVMPGRWPVGCRFEARCKYVDAARCGRSNAWDSQRVSETQRVRCCLFDTLDLEGSEAYYD